jgi:hypothetical protein
MASSPVCSNCTSVSVHTRRLLLNGLATRSPTARSKCTRIPVHTRRLLLPGLTLVCPSRNARSGPGVVGVVVGSGGGGGGGGGGGRGGGGRGNNFTATRRRRGLGRPFRNGRGGSGRGGGRSTNFSGNEPGCRGLHSSNFRLNVSAFCAIGGALRGSLGGCEGCFSVYEGLFRVYFVSETAQVELKSGRV